MLLGTQMLPDLSEFSLIDTLAHHHSSEILLDQLLSVCFSCQTLSSMMAGLGFLQYVLWI